MPAIAFPTHPTRLDYTVTPWTDPSGTDWLWNESKLRWRAEVSAGGGGASTFAELTDKATADLPAINGPLGDVLALKAPLASPTFTTPALGVATATSLNASGTVTGSNLSGTNTGDQTNITGNAATVTTNANLTGVVTSVGNATAIANGALTLSKLNQSGATSGQSPVWSTLSSSWVPDGPFAKLNTDSPYFVHATTPIGLITTSGSLLSGTPAEGRTALSLVPGTDIVAYNGALGTPSSGVGTNLTALNGDNISTGNIARARIDNALSANAAPIVATTVTASGAVSGATGVFSSYLQLTASSRLSGGFGGSSIVASLNSSGAETGGAFLAEQFYVRSAGGSVALLIGNEGRWNSAGRLGFTSGTNPGATSLDVAFSRLGTGSVGLGTGAAGSTAGSLSLTNLTASGTLAVTGVSTHMGGSKLGATVVNSLPSASSNTYLELIVTDSLAPVAGSTVASGGSAKCKVCSNGTNWIVTATL